MSTKRILVAYGTRHPATAGIAEQIAKTLREDGLDADAVVLGGSPYAGRWNSKATHCAERNAESLRRPHHGPHPERIQNWAHHISAELVAA
ncbi:hypothetical protein [Streptomyces xanthophaeus]|uniref:hypothetical protein n=1 Tax=Streptomyces xanthophaeus TaxID=67385 RepID=UPI00264A3030|nr:hypothetical protein [Streptomyces xanthophaeus]WKD31188.1 hypothetical protein KO717_03900 [Streptomyces xanthophaeus]